MKRYTDTEKTRGRKSERIVEVFSVPPNLDPKWPQVDCVIKVERKGTRGEEPYERIGYYMTSVSPSSRRLAEGIRGHWFIENRLHWVKDVIYQEDIGSIPLILIASLRHWFSRVKKKLDTSHRKSL